MCNGNMDSSSIRKTDRIIGKSVDVDCDAAIDSQLSKLPKTLLVEIQQHQVRQRSHLTHIHTKVPFSLLSEIKDYRNREQQRGRQNEILDIVCGILQVAAAGGDQCQEEVKNNCSFLSPMKKSRTLDVDKSKLCMLSLDSDSDEECEDDESEKASVATSSTATSSSSTTQDTPRKVHFNPLTSIQFTISREEITEEEKKEYWLQDQEFALIRMRDGYLGNLVEQKQREMDAGFATDTYALTPSSIAISPQHWICTRGLEYKMKRGFLRTKDRRLRCLEQVLVEQERQWDEHWDDGRNESPFYYDFGALAAVSIDISFECKIHARNVAANDRREVEELLQAEEAQEESKE